MLPSSLGQYRRKARCDVRHFLDRIHTKRNEIKKALPSQVLQEACDIADEKNLCIVSGLHSCYHAGYAETIQRIHNGAIGDINTYPVPIPGQTSFELFKT